MNKILLKKYFQNLCTAEELEAVELFLRQPGSEHLIKEIIEEDWTNFNSPQLDQKIRERYQARFLSKHSKEKSKSKRSLIVRNWLKYAAIFLVFAGIGSYLITRRADVDYHRVTLLERKNARGQRSIITLSDSTIVYLGAGSDVKFPENFTGSTREIALEGEAFFEVKKDHKHPFIIHTGSVQTKVLGTSFKIEAFKGHLLTVSVVTGKVRVDQKFTLPAKHLNALAVLTPGQKVSFNTLTNQAYIGTAPISSIQQWKTGNLFFDKERMDEVAAILERYYDVEIKISDEQIRSYRVNTSFRSNESIDQVMQILAATVNFDFKIQGKQIIIRRRSMK